MRNDRLFDEAVADPMNRNDVLRLRWVRFDFLTQPGDMIINRAGNGTALISPNFVQQLIACDDFTATPNQVAQDLKLASGKIQRLAAFARREFLKVQLDIAKVKTFDITDLSYSPSQMRPDSREQFHNAKWFRHVIIGADFQPNHLVNFLVPSSQHKNWDFDSTGSQGAAHIDSAHQRQHHIEQNEVRFLGRDLL